MSNLGSKIESAAVLLAEDQTFTATPNFYKGRGSDDKEGPAVIFKAIVENEEPLFTGNFYVTLEAVVRSVAADGETAHNILAGEIHNMLALDDLAAQLTAKVDNLYVFDPALEMGGSGPEVDGDCLEEIITRRLYCNQLSS